MAGLEELNDLLDRWVRSVYHARVHSETGAAPLALPDGERAPEIPVVVVTAHDES